MIVEQKICYSLITESSSSLIPFAVSAKIRKSLQIFILKLRLVFFIGGFETNL